MLLLIELIVCLAVLVVFPVPHRAWVRAAAIVILVGLLSALTFLKHERKWVEEFQSRVRSERLKSVLAGVQRAFKGAERLDGRET